jgi:uracil-DNA glycosylase
MLQVTSLFPKFDQLQARFGSQKLRSIYGAGKIINPEICLIFMNPTARNVAASASWEGIRAPWLGTKNVWKLLDKIGLFRNRSMLSKIQNMKPEDWTPAFAHDLYNEVAKESVYITNIAKCTQDDARHLPDAVFKKYLPLMFTELELLKPRIVLTLGNQVSSVLLGRSISVSDYRHYEYEELSTPNKINLKVYPAYYPVGQGTPNISKTIARLRRIRRMLALSPETD